MRALHELSSSEKEVRDHRYSLNIHPVYKRVDSCAAEFASLQPICIPLMKKSVKQIRLIQKDYGVGWWSKPYWSGY